MPSSTSAALVQALDALVKNAASDQLFRLLVASVRDYAIIVLDTQGRVATWNEGARRIQRYAADEILGRHFSVFYTPEDVRGGKCEAQLEAAKSEGRFQDEGWRVRKDGARFWAHVLLTAMRDERGELVGFAEITRDLTERRAADEQRSAVEARFRLFVASVKDYALFVLDTQGVVSTWNEGARRIKGYSADEIVGRHFSAFYPEEDVRAGKCDMELEVAAREGRSEDEGWRLRKDGTQFWANVVITAMRDECGELVGFAKITRDLTERKRHEEDRAARLAAEQANKAKDEFLAMLGHELRNPLAPIATALQLIKLRGDTRSEREHEVIDRQVRNLMRLVDDLLDVARIARGKIELKKHRFDVRDVVAKAIELATPLIEQRDHRFEVNAPLRPLLIDADEARLIQVFTNLLTNAAKYTDPGGHIFVTLRRLPDQVVVEVRDDGQGIAADLLPRIFEQFVQGPQGPERSRGGLGLGLPLVRALVQLHGGEVSAHSDGPRLGSTFTVSLPAAETPAGAEETESAVAASLPEPAGLAAANRRCRILLVDDNEDARMLLDDVLATLGHDVRSAGDPSGALALLETFSPDVAILDIGLPDMDGYELASKIRERLGDANPQVIALSGYGQPSDRERSQAAGFARHFVKPVEIRKLLDAIAALKS